MEDGWVKVNLKKRLRHPPGITVSGDVITSAGEPLFLSIFADPLNPLLNYFEYLIEDVGKQTAIGIGVGERQYSMSAMPGWNSNSCGYHADDGKLFLQAGFGQEFAETCTAGDRMGCGVEFDGEGAGGGEVNVFFTKNGQQVGRVVKIKRPFEGLYPMIGLHSGGEKIRYIGHSRRDLGTVAQVMEFWEAHEHEWLRSNGIRFLEDGLTLEYAGTEGLDVAVAQSRYALNATRHYFEIELRKVVEGGAIYIGAGEATYPLHCFPGQELKGGHCTSVGYRSNGCVFRGLDEEILLHAACEGDRIGLGLKVNDASEAETKDLSSSESSQSDCDENQPAELNQFPIAIGEDADLYRVARLAELRRRQLVVRRRPVALRRKYIPKERTLSNEKSDKTCVVFFTWNGEVVGETDISMPRGGLYPLVAMATAGEQVRVNFNPLTG